MRILLLALNESIADTINWFMRLGKPKQTASLLAFNVDWFTNSTWIERLIAYKQISKFIVK